ncbi:Uncharacterized protein TCM_046065 [Theobroma cacao]|uniref:Uncharacterized protein n=1 Tax=Theobroma cacao TaxID=3641 RepID=S1SMT8_THECC|nr:Uncharacterized protein TCM_046065 [Theobroma cacao]
MLNLINCPILKTFTSNSVIDEVGDEPQIDQNAQVGDEPQIDQNAQGNNSALFNEKVIFPGLKTLTIKAMGSCRRIWQDQLTVNSFCKLNNIWVRL